MVLFVASRVAITVYSYSFMPSTLGLRDTGNGIYAIVVYFLIMSESESELLLVIRLNDNHSPGPVIKEVSP